MWILFDGKWKVMLHNKTIKEFDTRKEAENFIAQQNAYQIGGEVKCSH